MAQQAKHLSLAPSSQLARGLPGARFHYFVPMTFFVLLPMAWFLLWGEHLGEHTREPNGPYQPGLHYIATPRSETVSSAGAFVESLQNPSIDTIVVEKVWGENTCMPLHNPCFSYGGVGW